MVATSTLKELEFDTALQVVDEGGAFIDLRPVGDYLDVHIPGSIELLYEFGPGMASRARDCIPLNVPLVLLDLGHGDVMNAAASLRGKGFTVVGKVEDGLNRWAGARATPASTEVMHGVQRPGGTVLDVGDSGAPQVDNATRVPIELLWSKLDDFRDTHQVTVVAGYGVRAALAVGVLERAGVGSIVFWWGPRG